MNSTHRWPSSWFQTQYEDARRNPYHVMAMHLATAGYPGHAEPRASSGRACWVLGKAQRRVHHRCVSEPRRSRVPCRRSRTSGLSPSARALDVGFAGAQAVPSSTSPVTPLSRKPHPSPGLQTGSLHWCLVSKPRLTHWTGPLPSLTGSSHVLSKQGCLSVPPFPLAVTRATQLLQAETCKSSSASSFLPHPSPTPEPSLTDATSGIRPLVSQPPQPASSPGHLGVSPGFSQQPCQQSSPFHHHLQPK